MDGCADRARFAGPHSSSPSFAPMLQSAKPAPNSRHSRKLCGRQGPCETPTVPVSVYLRRVLCCLNCGLADAIARPFEFRRLPVALEQPSVPPHRSRLTKASRAPNPKKQSVQTGGHERRSNFGKLNSLPTSVHPETARGSQQIEWQSCRSAVIRVRSLTIPARCPREARRYNSRDGEGHLNFDRWIDQETWKMRDRIEWDRANISRARRCRPRSIGIYAAHIGAEAS